MTAIISKLPEPMDWRVSSIAGNKASSIIEDKFNELNTLLNKITDDAEEAIERIWAEGVRLDNVAKIGVAADTPKTFSPEQYSPVKDISVSLSTKPELDTSITAPTEPTKTNITFSAFNKSAPAFLNTAPPSSDIVYSEPEYTSVLSDTLADSIIQTIIAGGKSLGNAVEDAIWARSRDRIADEYDTLHDITAHKWAAAGWDIPTGMEQAALADIANRKTRALEQLNYELTAEQAKLALNEFQMAREAGIKLEALFRSTFSDKWNRMVQVAIEGQKAAITLYATLVEYDKMRAEIYKIEADVWRTSENTKLEFAKFDIDLYKTSVDAYSARWMAEKAKMEAYVAATQAEIGKANIELDNEKLRVNAFYNWQQNMLGYENTKASLVKIDSDNRNTENTVNTDIAKFNIQNVLEKARLQQAVLTEVAKLYNQQLASLYSAFNISASLGDSESSNTSLSHSYSHQDSVSASVSENYEGKL